MGAPDHRHRAEMRAVTAGEPGESNLRPQRSGGGWRRCDRHRLPRPRNRRTHGLSGRQGTGLCGDQLGASGASVPGVGGGRDYALWGYSQGGHAALFAADLSARYAPELNLKAVAAVAPPTDLARLLRANIGSVPGRILAAFTLASWNAKYGAPLQMLVDAAAAAVISEVGRSCVDDLGGEFDAAAAQKALTANFLKTDPARLAPWSGLLAENSRFAQAVRLPTLIIRGDSDDLVRPAVTTAFVKSSCRAGVPVQYNVLKGKGHGAAIDASARGRRQLAGVAPEQYPHPRQLPVRQARSR